MNNCDNCIFWGGAVGDCMRVDCNPIPDMLCDDCGGDFWFCECD